MVRRGPTEETAKNSKMANDIELERTGTLETVKDDTEGDKEDPSAESDPLTQLRKVRTVVFALACDFRHS